MQDYKLVFARIIQSLTDTLMIGTQRTFLVKHATRPIHENYAGERGSALMFTCSHYRFCIDMILTINEH